MIIPILISPGAVLLNLPHTHTNKGARRGGGTTTTTRAVAPTGASLQRASPPPLWRAPTLSRPTHAGPRPDRNPHAHACYTAIPLTNINIQTAEAPCMTCINVRTVPQTARALCWYAFFRTVAIFPFCAFKCRSSTAAQPFSWSTSRRRAPK